ncbi:hypothetical protein GW17_00020381 [Ensete ventricosum]|uniref:Uncharacterized protein n=1 Tax=Ensete ventricosum TaxID=4639 RepID=A0A444EZE0_ENSVE|nr:hypothetical protein B296_00013136 [Ensete ventricosum]RWW15762.1 hypothetical protein GW17_00020381 [Ensete ventricosum]RZR98623.1 hypothetical protein BHM03_00028049 [Ensete ventricosum]
MDMYQKTGVRWGQAGMGNVDLVSGREMKAPHVDGEKVGAVATPHSHRLEQTGKGNTHLQDHSKRELDRSKATVKAKGGGGGGGERQPKWANRMSKTEAQKRNKRSEREQGHEQSRLSKE